MRRRGGVKDDGNAREPGNGLLEQLQEFDVGLGHHDGEPGDIAARPREAGHVAAAERVRVAHEDYGNRRGRSLGRPGVDGTRGNDDIDLEPDQFLRKFAHPFRLPLRPPILDGDGPTLYVAQVAQSAAESFDGIRKHGRTVPQESDTPEVALLLRERAKRRREQTRAKNYQDFAAFDHLITPSVKANAPSITPISAHPKQNAGGLLDANQRSASFFRGF